MQTQTEQIFDSLVDHKDIVGLYNNIAFVYSDLLEGYTSMSKSLYYLQETFSCYDYDINTHVYKIINEARIIPDIVYIQFNEAKAYILSRVESEIVDSIQFMKSRLKDSAESIIYFLKHDLKKIDTSNNDTVESEIYQSFNRQNVIYLRESAKSNKEKYKRKQVKSENSIYENAIRRATTKRTNYNNTIDEVMRTHAHHIGVNYLHILLFNEPNVKLAVSQLSKHQDWLRKARQKLPTLYSMLYSIHVVTDKYYMDYDTISASIKVNIQTLIDSNDAYITDQLSTALANDISRQFLVGSYISVFNGKAVRIDSIPLMDEIGILFSGHFDFIQNYVNSSSQNVLFQNQNQKHVEFKI